MKYKINLEQITKSIGELNNNLYVTFLIVSLTILLLSIIILLAMNGPYNTWTRVIGALYDPIRDTQYRRNRPGLCDVRYRHIPIGTRVSTDTNTVYHMEGDCIHIYDSLDFTGRHLTGMLANYFTHSGTIYVNGYQIRGYTLPVAEITYLASPQPNMVRPILTEIERLRPREIVLYTTRYQPITMHNTLDASSNQYTVKIAISQ